MKFDAPGELVAYVAANGTGAPPWSTLGNVFAWCVLIDPKLGYDPTRVTDAELDGKTLVLSLAGGSTLHVMEATGIELNDGLVTIDAAKRIRYVQPFTTWNEHGVQEWSHVTSFDGISGSGAAAPALSFRDVPG